MIQYIKENKGWILLNLPALVILIFLIIEPNMHKTMRAWTGYIAVSLLVLLLAINPLKTLLKNIILLSKISRYRRVIGVAIFTYSALHLLCYLIKKGGILAAMKYVFHPVIITGLVGFIIFAPLAITSNNYFVKKMGHIKWKKLHEKVYVAEFGVMMHMILMGGTARLVGVLCFMPLIVIQYMRRVRKKRLKNR
ncbi:MAG: ferric reductase-like transmembrane domain-containing protein [Pseudomonadota bacterium]